MPKISVIMPSLNVVSYIGEAVQSVIDQTLSDIEILCIDAGSTDGTWEILEKFAAKDERIRLIRSEKKSYGYQMNLGIREAKGEYIGIVETDDYIRPQMYETLYRVAKEQETDFVKSDFDVFVTAQDEERLFLRYSLQKFGGIDYERIFSADDYIHRHSTVDIFIWNGIYRRQFLLDNDIRLQETPGAAFQDCGFRYQVALNVKRGYFIADSFYCYRRDNVGSSTYNNKTVLFNLNECKYILSLVKKKGIKDKAALEFIAREMFVIANGPYLDLLRWKEPAEDTAEALDEFRDILRGFIKQGLLSEQNLPFNMWMDMQIFLKDSLLYDYYAHTYAQTAASYTRSFLERMRSQSQIVIFGSGLLGKSAYMLLRTNHIDKVTAFADNAEEKWETYCMGCVIASPQELVRKYPDAGYLIANAAHESQICDQLVAYGISTDRILTYTLGSSPLNCTNILVD